MPRLVLDWCHHFPNGIIDPSHSCDARICLIGEAPGKNEDRLGIPFVGQAGFALDQWLEKAGLHRSDLYITNVLNRRPANNDLATVPKMEIDAGTENLHAAISKLANPYIIVPTGNTSLNALFRTDYGRRMRITDWRGSILRYVDRSGRSVKVIPTIHPAATFREPILAKFCIADWLRIGQDKEFKELKLPQRDLIVDPGRSVIEDFTYKAFSKTGDALRDGSPACLSIDVENTMDKNGRFQAMTCIGFSYDPSMGMSISLRKQDYENKDGYDFAWESAKKLCNLPIAKVMQNGLTDAYKLKYCGIDVINYQYDLMEMDHAYDPNDGGATEKGSEDAVGDRTYKVEMRSLKVLASLYTREPFYKLEGKMGPGFDFVDYLRYNCKDACVTREIFTALWHKLKSRGLA